MSASTLPRLELLGTPRLVFAHGEPHILERRDAAMLAWLALRGATPRDRIAQLLWPDTAKRAAQTNLRQRLFRIRRRLGADLIVSSPILALADAVQHDLASTTPMALDAARAAMPVLLGELRYDDCGELEDWVAEARERWAGQHRDRLARHAAELESTGRLAEALAFAERLTAEAPTAEHAHRRVMRLHYTRGDRAAALMAFERCGAALARELGAQPGAETRELAALIERSGALVAPVAAPSPVATLRPPRLIGRDAEWRAIELAWQSHRAVLLIGEPGLGKSRLASDFAAAHRASQIVRAHAGDRLVPYCLLARLLRGLIDSFGAPPGGWCVTELTRLLPELGEPPLGRLEPLHMRRAIDSAMAHWQTHGLATLVIDDLHFADSASLEWLLAWADRSPRPDLLMTVRPNELPAVLRGWLAEHGDSSLSALTLGTLNLTAVAALLDSLAIPQLDSAAWAEPLTRHTGGNPLFILETLKAQQANGPDAWRRARPTWAALPQIGRLLEARLQQLTPGALRLARVAALAGPDFNADLAARVLGCHVLDLSESWAELERAQIVNGNAFAHDLILDATLRTVPGPIASAMHRAIAQALEGHGPPARQADHWQAAGEWARAAPCFEHAARAATATARPVEALAMWDAATSCHERSGDRAAAFRSRTQAIEPAIVASPSEQVKARVDTLAADSRDDPEKLAALIAQAKHASTGGQYDVALVSTTAAIDLARRIGDRRQELAAANVHGVALTVTGHVAAGIAFFESLAGSASVDDDPHVESEFFSAYAFALHSGGRFGESAARFQRAIDAAERLGDINLLAINLGNRATCLGHLGRNDEALAAAQRAHGLQARLGIVRGEPYAISLLNLAMFQLAAGQFDNALAAYQRALDLCRETGATGVIGILENHLANAYLRLGQPARARQTLSPMSTTAPAAARIRRAVIEWRIDAFATPIGPERLLATLRDVGDQSTVIDRMGLELAIVAALDAEESLAWTTRIGRETLALGQPTVALSALIRRADAERRCGLHDAAAASAREAVADSADCGRHDLPTDEFWWLAFAVFDAADCQTEARDALQNGIDWVNQALVHVPEPFRESFLHRGKFVPRLKAMAAQRLRNTET